jgi:hypothetical protein
MSNALQGAPQEHVRAHKGYENVLNAARLVLQGETKEHIAPTDLGASIQMFTPPRMLDSALGELKYHKETLALPPPPSSMELAWRDHGMSYETFVRDSAAYLAHLGQARLDADGLRGALDVAVLFAVLPEIVPEARVASRTPRSAVIEYDASRMVFCMNSILMGSARQQGGQTSLRSPVEYVHERWLGETPAALASIWRFCVREQFKLGELYAQFIRV